MHHPLTTSLIVMGVATGITAIVYAAVTGQLHLGMGGFLIGFGILKCGLGLDALMRWRSGAAPDPTAGQRSAMTLVLWIGFRFVVALVAIAMGAWLMASPHALQLRP